MKKIRKILDKRVFKELYGTILFVLLCSAISPSTAQSDSTIVAPIHLEGPRFGFTIVTPGELADDMDNQLGINPFITQFGWQFETRFFDLPNGTSGLVEAVLLVGGLEQNVFLPSASFLVGLRGKNGFEFGFGPNLSLAGAALVFAAGVTIRSNNLNIPINLAIVPSSDGGGTRISLLTGFNTRRR